MSNESHLERFRDLVKKSFGFYRAHWKHLVYFFLPIEIAIFELTLIIKFGLTPARFSFVVVLSFLLYITLFLIKSFRCLAVFSGGLVCEGAREKINTKRIYQSIWNEILPIIQVALIQAIIAFAFGVFIITLAILLFVSPFVLMGFIAGASPSALELFQFHGGYISAFMLMLSGSLAIIGYVFLLSEIWFASYAVVFLKRRGLDAIATSVEFTRGKRRQISWRIILIFIISAIPAFIILAPVCFRIVEALLPKIILQLLLYTSYGISIRWPEIPSVFVFWHSLSGFLASLVSLPIFISLNYFLWKSVKDTALPFLESRYEKSRKYAKYWASAGIICFCICVVIYFAL